MKVKRCACRGWRAPDVPLASLASACLPTCLGLGGAGLSKEGPWKAIHRLHTPRDGTCQAYDVSKCAVRRTWREGLVLLFMVDKALPEDLNRWLRAPFPLWQFVRLCEIVVSVVTWLPLMVSRRRSPVIRGKKQSPLT